MLRERGRERGKRECEKEGGREREGESEKRREGERGKERVRKGGRERELITLLNGSIIIYKSFKFECFLNELDKIITLVKIFK